MNRGSQLGAVAALVALFVLVGVISVKVLRGAPDEALAVFGDVDISATGSAAEGTDPETAQDIPRAIGVAGVSTEPPNVHMAGAAIPAGTAPGSSSTGLTTSTVRASAPSSGGTTTTATVSSASTATTDGTTTTGDSPTTGSATTTTDTASTGATTTTTAGSTSTTAQSGSTSTSSGTTTTTAADGDIDLCELLGGTFCE